MCSTSNGGRNKGMETMRDKEDGTEEGNRDLLSAAIGEFGKWHLSLFLFLSIPVKMSAAWAQLGIIFLAPKTIFRCVEMASGMKIENSTCYSDCVKYEYFTEFGNTIISEWELICERAWLASFAQTMCMFGVLVGSVMFGFVADRYGRRPALLIASTLQLFASLSESYCPDYWSFTIVRLLLGSATAGLMVVSFVILVEIIGSNKREIMNSIYHLPLSCGQMLMVLFAYYLRSWDKFSLGVAIPNFIFLLYFFIVPESPKWLISVGRLEEASLVMTKVAKYNKLPTENMLEVAKSIAAESSKNSREKQRAKATYIDLIRLPSLRAKNLCSCICWFVLGLSFYGSNQYIGQTSSNIFVTVALAGALQAPGILLSGYFCRRFGRRATAAGFYVVNVISNALLAVPDEWFLVKLIAGSVGVSCSAAAFSVMYVYTSELFPTVARNMAMGASSTVSRIGSMLAPFVASLGSEAIWAPPIVFTIAPLLGLGACLLLPETKGRKLNDYVVDT